MQSLEAVACSVFQIKQHAYFHLIQFFSVDANEHDLRVYPDEIFDPIEPKPYNVPFLPLGTTSFQIAKSSRIGDGVGVEFVVGVDVGVGVCVGVRVVVGIGSVDDEYGVGIGIGVVVGIGGVGVGVRVVGICIVDDGFGVGVGIGVVVGIGGVGVGESCKISLPLLATRRPREVVDLSPLFVPLPAI
ncbi:hypothetical protein TSUD_280300 [Trifolium subterraneum]|uniref:Uncharacterized protein n=1 Tax=Trifolium subterraneum TaxID=3900 RepID=A0A2Z6NWL9_TRISU|nr:hypothetical protein TSUD_280300 [Trifolium subterraneum]